MNMFMLRPKICSATSDEEKLLFCIAMESAIMNNILHLIENDVWKKIFKEILMELEDYTSEELEKAIDNSAQEDWRFWPYIFVSIITVLKVRIVDQIYNNKK